MDPDIIESPRNVISVIVQPDYAGPMTYVPPSRGPVRFAIGSALVPLALGILVFLSWIPTRSDSLALLGLLNIGFGLFSTAIGTVSLLWYLAMTPGGPSVRIRRFVAGSWVAILLLAINFPACWLILKGVDYVETKFPRHVYNRDMGD